MSTIYYHIKNIYAKARKGSRPEYRVINWKKNDKVMGV